MRNIKRFEDFLDRMQGLLDNAKEQGQLIVRVEDLENTFPELKESEDERIRKELISFLQLPHPQFAGKRNQEKWLAWLEKQGEQKPIDYNKELKKCRENPLYFFVKYVKPKLKEQKSVWSEEDEYLLNETIQHLEELIRIDKVKHCACDVQYYQRDIDWLKAIKLRMNND